MATGLEALLTRILNPEQNWQLQLLANWSSILGNLKTKVELLKIQENTLILGVSDACWLQELYLLSPLLLKTINEKLDQPRIKQLRFKATATYRRKQAPVRPPKKIYKPVHLSAKEEKALSVICDTQLQKALKEYLIRCYQEKE